MVQDHQRDAITPLNKLRLFVDLLAQQAAREFNAVSPLGTATNVVCPTGTSTTA